jgi:pyruvate ferredoxin oxidoreductase alpha subunit
MGTVRYVVDQLREEGIKAGLIKLRVFRPLPTKAIIETAQNIPVLGVLDKAASFGAPGGPLYEELKTTFYDQEKKPIIKGIIHGLGGRDTSPTMIKGIYNDLLEVKKTGKATEQVAFVGVRE